MTAPIMEFSKDTPGPGPANRQPAIGPVSLSGAGLMAPGIAVSRLSAPFFASAVFVVRKSPIGIFLAAMSGG